MSYWKICKEKERNEKYSQENMNNFYFKYCIVCHHENPIDLLNNKVYVRNPVAMKQS